MFRDLRKTEKQTTSEQARRTPSNDANARYGPVEQVRDFICAYIDGPSRPAENAVQQRMDRTTEMLGLAFSGHPESCGGAPLPYLFDQLIEITTAVVERHQREERSELETRKPAEMPAWIAPSPIKPAAAIATEP